MPNAPPPPDPGPDPAPESDDDDEGGDAMMDGQTQRQLSERERRAINAGLELASLLSL